MTSSEKFSIKWDDFQKNVSSSFREIREDFCDVTLTCEANMKITAHKVILAASSNFFREILTENQHPHPLLYMRGIKGVHLKSVIDFIYHGEVNVFEEDLDKFLSVAEELQLKGLVGKEKAKNSPQIKSIKPVYSLPAKPRTKVITSNTIETSLEKSGSEDIKIEDQIYETVNKDKMVAINPREGKITTTIERLDGVIRSLMKFSDGHWSCIKCGKMNTKNVPIMNHIKRKHLEVIWS